MRESICEESEFRKSDESESCLNDQAAREFEKRESLKTDYEKRLAFVLKQNLQTIASFILSIDSYMLLQTNKLAEFDFC